MTKEGSKKSWRVFYKGVEGMGSRKKGEKGKEKKKGSGKKQKWDEEEDKENAEDRELEIESSWQSFVTARMAMMDLELDKLQRENEMLQEEIRNIKEENMED